MINVKFIVLFALLMFGFSCSSFDTLTIVEIPISGDMVYNAEPNDIDENSINYFHKFFENVKGDNRFSKYIEKDTILILNDIREPLIIGCEDYGIVNDEKIYSFHFCGETEQIELSEYANEYSSLLVDKIFNRNYSELKLIIDNAFEDSNHKNNISKNHDYYSLYCYLVIRDSSKTAVLDYIKLEANTLFYKNLVPN